jgi:hypothetical protein
LTGEIQRFVQQQVLYFNFKMRSHKKIRLDSASSKNGFLRAFVYL